MAYSRYRSRVWKVTASNIRGLATAMATALRRSDRARTGLVGGRTPIVSHFRTLTLPSTLLDSSYDIPATTRRVSTPITYSLDRKPTMRVTCWNADVSGTRSRPIASMVTNSMSPTRTSRPGASVIVEPVARELLGDYENVAEKSEQ